MHKIIVGDWIKIAYATALPQYMGRVGQVTKVNEEKIWGTWGEYPLYIDVDDYLIINEDGTKRYEEDEDYFDYRGEPEVVEALYKYR